VLTRGIALSIMPCCTIDPAKCIYSSLVIPGMEDCQLVIKGQTNAPAAGFANINAEVSIDMNQLNSTAVNAEQTTVSLGGGAAWTDVYLY